jgi:hypothetical protein
MFLYDARLLFVMGVFAFLTPIIATLFPDSFLGRLVFRGWKRPITGKSKRAMYVLGVGISAGGFRGCPIFEPLGNERSDVGRLAR